MPMQASSNALPQQERTIPSLQLKFAAAACSRRATCLTVLPAYDVAAYARGQNVFVVKVSTMCVADEGMFDQRLLIVDDRRQG